MADFVLGRITFGPPMALPNVNRSPIPPVLDPDGVPYERGFWSLECASCGYESGGFTLIAKPWKCGKCGEMTTPGQNEWRTANFEGKQ